MPGKRLRDLLIVLPGITGSVLQKDGQQYTARPDCGLRSNRESSGRCRAILLPFSSPIVRLISRPRWTCSFTLSQARSSARYVSLSAC